MMYDTKTQLPRCNLGGLCVSGKCSDISFVQEYNAAFDLLQDDPTDLDEDDAHGLEESDDKYVSTEQSDNGKSLDASDSDNTEVTDEQADSDQSTQGKYHIATDGKNL